MITNFFSRAALAKVASFHSLQKPSLLSIGAECAAPANSSESSSASMRIMGRPSSVVVGRNIGRSCYRLKHTAP